MNAAERPNLTTVRTLLVANRGEVASRVIATCRTLGIRTVAVYSDPDLGGSFVAEADVAVRIGPAPPAESYLCVAAILAAAVATSADAIHPGWGFLAESADFAEAVLKAGLVWIGPPPAAMRAVGDKAAARALAQQLGIPVMAGTGPVTDTEAPAAAAALGFPLRVKAVAGGGGRGQRTVWEAGGLPDAIAAARREAASAFGNDAVLLERHATRPRHVEVQFMADSFGTVVVLGDRDCSVQRQDQKIAEEAPAPALEPRLRKTLHDAARQLAAAVHYRSAGTAEFLVQPDGSVAFLEINARLQVEHAVTEAVTDLDLVALQIAVAEGEALAPQDVVPRGHAVEVRIVAENPNDAWRGSIGRLLRFDIPAGDGIRVDSGVRAGDKVTAHYDGLLAKVIATAPDRGRALRRLANALDAAWAPGITTNLPLLRALVRHPAFVAAQLHTSFLAGNGLPDPVPDHAEEVACVAVLVGQYRRASGISGVPPGFRITGPMTQEDRFAAPGRTVVVGWTATDRGARLAIAGNVLTCSVVPLGGDCWRLERNGEVRNVRVLETGDDEQGAIYVHFGDHEGMVIRVPRFPLPAASTAAPGTTVAPGPGTVTRVWVKLGDVVQAGARLVAMEAMKVETLVHAPEGGTVTAVFVAPGDTVDTGTVLVGLATADPLC